MESIVGQIQGNPALAIAAVFIGGIVSSASPCVLALVPLVIGYVGGYSGGDKKKALLYSLAFAAGLSVTFTLMGAAAGFDNAGSTISTQSAAQVALDAIDSAIRIKDTIRANLGGIANRLANTISNLSIQAENLQNAESRISDVDVATEMTEFTRNQILVQAGVSMLAQANSLPQLALKLMGG